MTDQEPVAASPAPSGGRAPAVAGCLTCGQPTPPQQSQQPAAVRVGLVYAVGRLSAQFPSVGVEREFAQLADRSGDQRLFETALLHQVLSDPENTYLARHMCWVFSIRGQDVFAIRPRDDAELRQLIELIEPAGSDELIHVVVGRATPVEPGWPCSDAGLPVIAVDQLLGFSTDEFVTAVAGAAADAETTGKARRPAAADDQAQRGLAREVLLRLTRREDNRGVSDEHRAMNYLAMRYPPVYHAVAHAHEQGKALISVTARHSHAGSRRLVAVTLTFRHRRTEITERYQIVVDVTEVFPFLVGRLEPVYD